MKELIRKRRLQLIRSLRLQDHYQRTHTSTGVWRRKELLQDEKECRQMQRNKNSLANLKKGRSSSTAIRIAASYARREAAEETGR
jgi:hypothetical protein